MLDNGRSTRYALAMMNGLTAVRNCTVLNTMSSRMK
jgi:hypothetical protein